MNNSKRLILKQYIFIGMLIILVVLVGVNYFTRPFEKYFVVEENLIEETEEALERSDTDSLMKDEFFDKLSIEEKISQMIAYPIVIDKVDNIDNGEEKFIDELSPGFITIFGQEIASDSAKQKVTEINNLYKDNVFSPRFIVDHEGGSVQRLSGKGYTVLPSWKETCELGEIKMANLLEKSARELKSTGIDIVLAPVLDVGENPILKDRICSDSYAVVADKSVVYARAFGSFGILPVLKHFPGIGNINKDLHTDFDFVEVLQNDAELYKYVIEESLGVGVMVSHAGVLNQDSQVPCSLSKSCVDELKNTYANILVFSDALEMKSASFDKANVSEEKGLVQVSKEAVIAGNEILIYGQSIGSVDIKDIVFSLSKEYRNNPEFKELVDQAVLKIVNYKYAER
jgi:beta-N-acetylhexosaminidase